MSELEWTGERLVASIENEYFKFEHLHRYAIAQKLAHNKMVLDIACGEGYGSHIISKVAKFVYGVDVDSACIHHARQKYESQTGNISFLVGSTSAIPLDDSAVDLVVSFETIEHHDEHEEMMKEIKRVLKPDGILLISSPNKAVYNQLVPNNPFHLKELQPDEFENLLERFFKHCNYYEQRFVAGSLISPATTSIGKLSIYDGDYDDIRSDLAGKGYFNKAYYNIAICSAVKTGSDDLSSFFNGAGVIVKKITDSREKGRKEIMKTRSFKIGHFLISKFTFLRRLQPGKKTQ